MWLEDLPIHELSLNLMGSIWQVNIPFVPWIRHGLKHKNIKLISSIAIVNNHVANAFGGVMTIQQSWTLEAPKWPIIGRVGFIPSGSNHRTSVDEQGVDPITETKRKVFRFHAPILSFGEPGSLEIWLHYSITDSILPLVRHKNS